MIVAKPRTIVLQATVFAVVSFLALTAAGGAFSLTCPPGTVEVGVNVSTTETGGTKTINTNHVCQQIAPAPQPVMRAKTRAECVRDAGIQLKEDLGICRGPIMNCLTKEGVPDAAATCAESTLGTALLAAGGKVSGASRLSQVGLGLALESALRTCRVASKDIANACAPTAGTCEEGPLAAHKTAIKTCPVK